MRVEGQNKRMSNKICPEGMTIEEWQIALRREQAEYADFEVSHLDNNRIWGDYSVASKNGGCYRTAFRGVLSEKNYCACLDFRTNGLGTCKHLEAVQLYLRQEVDGYPWAGISYSPAYTSIYVNYKGGRKIQIRVGNDFSEEYQKLKEAYFDEKGVLPEENFYLLNTICELGEEISKTFRCYDDVRDFAQEVLNRQEWQAKLQELYPNQSIPFFEQETNNANALNQVLYRLCHQVNGIVLAPKHSSFTYLIARLTDELYQHLSNQELGFVILNSQAEVEQWRLAFLSEPRYKLLPIHILTESEFVELAEKDYPNCSFIYVDNADSLKEWKNPLSIALKKLKIAHLYMHLTSLEQLTPVQMSSILQHINPFILGPFYKFIHSSRLIFPLKDDGSNIPDSLVNLLTLVPDLTGFFEQKVQEIETALDWRILPKEEQVNMALRIFASLLEDEEGSALLREKINQLIH